MGLEKRGLTAAAVLLGAALVIGGCGSATTETGYEPRKLGLSEAQRKGLYAPQYSQEQARAQAEREQEMKARRPGLGFQ
jgi:hypothetical protein